jgi:hypothetical protein
MHGKAGLTLTALACSACLLLHAGLAQAADADLALRLEQFRPGCGGPQQWAQMYPVPQREPLQATG